MRDDVQVDLIKDIITRTADQIYDQVMIPKKEYIAELEDSVKFWQGKNKVLKEKSAIRITTAFVAGLIIGGFIMTAALLPMVNC